ncbi:hypothetical protein IWW43_002882, partial [Coemansia sp. RSA 1935]
MRTLVDVSKGPLPLASDKTLFTFTLVVFIISSWVSLMAFLYGLLIVYIQPRVWRSSIIRVVIVAQIINSIRFIIRILATFVDVKVDFGCRALLFLNNTLSMLPVNMCIYCVVYLQMIVIHNVSPKKRCPRVVALTLASVFAVVPTFMFMVIPARVLGNSSLCELNRVTSRKQYVFLMCTVAIWEYLPGVVGIISISIIGIYIVRTRRETQRALQASQEFYGPSHAFGEPGSSDLLHRTMIHIIWFPIMPILSLWLNIILISVAYYKRTTYIWLEYINTLMLALQSFLLGIALMVNPTVRAALAQHAKKRRREQREKTAPRAPDTADSD